MSLNFIPSDDAPLLDWLVFAKEVWPDQPIVEHLQDLAERDGYGYKVGFSTKDFFIYCYAINETRLQAQAALDDFKEIA